MNWEAVSATGGQGAGFGLLRGVLEYEGRLRSLAENSGYMSFDWAQRILARTLSHLSHLLPLITIVPRLPGQTPVFRLAEVAICPFACG